MKKLFTFILVALFCGSTMNAAITVSLKKTDWTGTISIWNWPTGENGSFVTATPDGEWYKYTFPESVTSINIIFVNGTTWNGDANQTVNIENIKQSTCYELVAGSGKRQVKEITCPVINDPTVYFSNLPAKVFIDQKITLTATSVNVTNPVYTYSVKAPGASGYQTVTSPYQPAAIGTYSFKVQVASSSAPGTFLAENVSAVEVTAVPAPIVISVKLPAGWSTVYMYSWTPGVNEWNPMTLVGGWYKFTVERVESLNFIFVDGSTWGEKDQQTVNVEDITKSTCFKIGDPDSEQEGKLKVTKVECDGAGINQPNDGGVSVLAGRGSISAFFDGTAAIQLYSVTGTLLKDAAAVGSFEQAGLVPGLYIIKINGKAAKALVK